MDIRPAEILLVEDNPGDVLLTQKAFERAKILNNLSVVTDGAEALDFVRRQAPFEEAPRPDLILMDINLPRVSGREALERIKADPELKRIPVVMLTSSDRPDDVEGAYGAHANSYITKPPSIAALVDVVKGIENYWFAIVRRPS